MSSEILFEVREDEVDGGYTASALGVGIHTEGESIEEIRENVREAENCYYDDADAPKSILRSVARHHKTDEKTLIEDL